MRASPAEPFFRLRSPPGAAWPTLADPQSSLLWSAYQHLDRTQWASPEEIERGQLAQVRSLLRHAAAEVPYYRRVLAGHGVRPDDIQTLADVRRLPVLTRRDVLDNAADIRADRLPAGMVATQTVSTSGGSGEPVTVRQTNLVQLWWLAFHLRELEWSGIDPRGRLAAVRYFKTSGPDGERLRAGVAVRHWNELLARLVENGPAFVMDVHQDPVRQLEWLRSVDPDVLLSFPSNLEFLARLVAGSDTRLPRLKVIQTISETLTDETRATIEAGFGVPVRDTYSCAEAGYLASPCPAGNGMHVHAENVLVEVLDATGNPAPHGEPGRVVVTTLQNFQTPLVRYEIGDTAALTPGVCRCGRGLPGLARVVGKTHPVLLLPDGRRVNSGRLSVVMRKVGGCYQFRVVQKSVDHFVVFVVPTLAWSFEHETRAREYVREFCGRPVRVDVTSVLQIPPLAGGKSADVVTEVK